MKLSKLRPGDEVVVIAALSLRPTRLLVVKCVAKQSVTTTDGVQLARCEVHGLPARLWVARAVLDRVHQSRTFFYVEATRVVERLFLHAVETKS